MTYNFKIDALSDSECRDLLNKISNIIADMPSFIDIDREGRCGRIYDPYFCCLGNTTNGHDYDCSIGQLRNIFGY
jgi:hypothetical protein